MPTDRNHMSKYLSATGKSIGPLFVLFFLAEPLLVSPSEPVPGGSNRTKLVIGGVTVTAQTHVIVISDEATVSELYAATELRDGLTSATGECIPIVRDSEPLASTRIPLIVGRSALIGKSTHPVDFDALGSDGIAIFTEGSVLVLTGNQRGVLYAAYSFLEDHVGFRWLTPDCTLVPSCRGLLRIDNLSVSYVPRFATRALDYWSAFNQDWAARNKVNGYGYAKKGSIDATHGGEVAYPDSSLFWSTLRFWIPLETYRGSHPEYFSEIGGRRVTTNNEDTDYCMTNAEVVQLTIAAVRKALRAAPNSTMISVSQNDHFSRYCRCPRCAELTAKQGAPSALVVHLVNQVAEAIEEEFPRVKLTTLAYHWSQKPPRDMKVHHNVIVEVCPLNLNQQTPLPETNSRLAKQLRADLDGWVRLCAPGNVKFCQYSINYSHLYQPHPNLHIFKPNMQYFADHGAGHFYDCGSYRSPGTEFAELRAYLIAKLAWNPEADADQLIEEFVAGYYGPAAPPILEYIHALRKHITSRPPMHLSAYANPDDGQITRELLAFGEAKMEEAERLVANDPVLRRRVLITRLPIRYGQIMLALSDFQVAANGTQLTSSLPNRIRDNLQPLLELLRQMDSPSIADVEIIPPSRWEYEIQEQAKCLPMDLVLLANDHFELTIVPAVNGRIWKMKDRATNRQLFGMWGTNHSALDGRGYAEFALPRSRGRWKDEGVFALAGKTSNSVTMQATLLDGLLSTRTLTLVENKAEVSFHTILANPTAQPIPIAFCTHPVFNVSDIGQARAEMLTNDTVTESKTMNPESVQGEEVWFHSPTGQWRIVDGKSKTVITNTFDPSLVENCLVWYDNRIWQGNVTMELRCRSVILQPGETFEFRHSYSITRMSP